MTTLPGAQSPPQYQVGQDHSQRGHHNRNIDDYSYAPYSESEHSHSFQSLKKINTPASNSSELSVEEIKREFPPSRAKPYHPYHESWYTLNFQNPTLSNMDSSLHENYEIRKDSQPSEKKFKQYHDRKSLTSFKTSEPEDRSLSRNQILLAAIGGAALAVGGKELWDRKNTRRNPVKSNPLRMAAIGAAGAFAGYEGAEIYSKYVKQEKNPQEIYVSGDKHRKNYSKNQDDVKSRRSKSRCRSSSNDSIDFSSTDSEYYDRKYVVKGHSHDSLNSVTQLQHLAKTALIAGATEALRVRKQPGTWSGSKGKSVLSAAIGASAIDAVAKESGKYHILETIIKGITSNRLINGPEYQVKNRPGRSRNPYRSRSRNSNKDITSSIATLVTAGVGALAAKELIERSRSRSRTTRSRRRPSLSSQSNSSSRENHGRLKHKRSKSIIEIARKGLYALGLGENKDHENHRTNFSRQRSHRSESDTDSPRILSHRHYRLDRDGRKTHRHDYKISRDENLKSRKSRNSHIGSHEKNNRNRHKDRKNLKDSDSYFSSRSSTENEIYRIGSRATKGN